MNEIMNNQKIGTLHNLEFKFEDECDICQKFTGTEEIETQTGDIIICRECFIKWCKEEDLK